MSLYALTLECIGDDQPPPRSRAFADAVVARKRPRVRPDRGVWEIESFDPPRRRGLTCQKDYSGANGIGSRGVMALYLLVPGRLYRVAEPLSWSRADRYYCCVEGGELRRFDDEAAARAWWDGRRA